MAIRPSQCLLRLFLLFRVLRYSYSHLFIPIPFLSPFLPQSFYRMYFGIILARLQPMEAIPPNSQPLRHRHRGSCLLCRITSNRRRLITYRRSMVGRCGRSGMPPAVWDLSCICRLPMEMIQKDGRRKRFRGTMVGSTMLADSGGPAMCCEKRALQISKTSLVQMHLHCITSFTSITMDSTKCGSVPRMGARALPAVMAA